jgi:hypothetical protein
VNADVRSEKKRMKRTATMLLGFLLVGCHAGSLPPQETITGFVVEKRADTKSFDSWNAPSDPYYVLERKEGAITLRPSPSIPTDKLATLRGKRLDAALK